MVEGDWWYKVDFIIRGIENSLLLRLNLKELPTVKYCNESCTTFFLLNGRDDGHNSSLDPVVLET
jgi:hypothetical protein